MIRRPPRSTLFPLHDALPIYPPAIDADLGLVYLSVGNAAPDIQGENRGGDNLFSASIVAVDRKSTRLNSSHLVISYAVFCLEKKNAFSKFFDSDPDLAAMKP